MEHKDLFSGHAKLYATFRPSYPKELVRFHLITHLLPIEVAWDCGTGNGQSSQLSRGSFLKKYSRQTSVQSNWKKRLQEATLFTQYLLQKKQHLLIMSLT